MAGTDSSHLARKAALRLVRFHAGFGRLAMMPTVPGCCFAVVVGIFAFVTLRVDGLAGAAEDLNRDLIADYRFAGRLQEFANRSASADITNAVVGASGLELLRGYENAGAGYRATFTVPALRYGDMTFVVDLEPRDFDNGARSANSIQRVTRWLMQMVGVGRNAGDHRNLITAGQGYRWIGFNHANGHLQLTLNNQDFTRDFTNTVLTTRRWHRLACSLDLTGRVVHVALDGQLLDSTPLPPDFVLRVIADPPPDGDRNLTFANYSNGQSFYGSVARLQVFGRALNREELLNLGVPEFPGLAASWLIPTGLVAACVALLFLAVWRASARRRRAL